MKIRKCIELDSNKNIMYQNLWDIANAILKGN